MLTPSLEDYLEEIYRLSINHGVVRASDVALRLHVTMPSVNNALRRLHQDNYVVYAKYRNIVLTEKGQRLGRYLVERNNVLQRFFSAINPSCDSLSEAEAVEHYLCYSSIRALEDLIDYWKTYPQVYEEFRSHAARRKERNEGLQNGYNDDESFI